MATQTKRNEFDKSCEDAGLEEGRSFAPFMDFKSEVGGFVIGLVGEPRAATYTPKKGKNKNKLQHVNYYAFDCERSTMKTVVAGEQYTISPTGLLEYQLNKGRPSYVKLPARVAIKYLGRDNEDRHQTEVRWPKGK